MVQILPYQSTSTWMLMDTERKDVDLFKLKHGSKLLVCCHASQARRDNRAEKHTCIKNMLMCSYQWINPQTGVIMRIHLVLRTDFTDNSRKPKEGAYNQIIQGLLPHQWGYFAANSVIPNKETYSSIRGDIKMLEGNAPFGSWNTRSKEFYQLYQILQCIRLTTTKINCNKKLMPPKTMLVSSWTDSYNVTVRS